MNKRIDRLTALHVDLAISIAQVFGLAAGLDALNEYGIDAAVGQRILIENRPYRGARPSSPNSLPDGPDWLP